MKANDMLSKFNKEELEELRKNIKNSTLPYREHLGFGFTDTFGVEIEYENLSRDMVIDIFSIIIVAIHLAVMKQFQQVEK